MLATLVLASFVAVPPEWCELPLELGGVCQGTQQRVREWRVDQPNRVRVHRLQLLLVCSVAQDTELIAGLTRMAMRPINARSRNVPTLSTSIATTLCILGHICSRLPQTRAALHRACCTEQLRLLTLSSDFARLLCIPYSASAPPVSPISPRCYGEVGTIAVKADHGDGSHLRIHSGQAAIHNASLLLVS